MSGIKNLLKFRFQRKGELTFPASRENGSISPNSSPSTSGQSTPVKDAPPVIPDTPESLRPSPSTSPVLGTSKRRCAKVLLSDSESDNDNPAAKTTTSSSAGWMSKESGKMMNGHTSVKTTSKSQLPKQRNSPQNSSQDSIDERELQSQVTMLLDMFPMYSREIIKEAILDSENFEKAIDYMIGYGTLGFVKKRSRAVSQVSDDSEPLGPPRKRSRPISYEDSMEDSVNEQTAGSMDEAAYSQPCLPPDVSMEVYKDRISFLEGAFPGVPKEVLHSTLQNKNYDVEPTLDALASFDPASYKPMSVTQSYGSIKLFKAARNHSKPSVSLEQDSEDNDEDKDEDFASDDDVGQKNHQKRRVKARFKDMDSDDDDMQEGMTREERETLDILSFFNDATLEELTAVNGCSKKKAEYIHEIRPFEDWEDLVRKFEDSPSGKSLAFSLITNCKEVMKIRKIVKKLMQRCERLSSELERFVSDLMGKTAIEESDREEGYITKQPKLLNQCMKLAPYQMVGLNWMYLMHTQELNGILGDEMGLGKTIQTIAFLSHLLEEGDPGPHVIVAPSSTIDNWLRELKLWCPALKVLVYYGSQEERREMRYAVMDGSMEEFNVVVTSYNLASGSTGDRVFFKKTQFHYSIFDEGHMLKNMESIRYQSLMKIRAEKRLLLTGTPLQNNLIELMSLLAFVMPDLFTGKTEHLKKIFNSISAKHSQGDRGNYEKETIAHCKNILKPFFLRRLKTEVLQQLPDKKDIVEHIPMAFEQQDLYDELKNKFTKSVRQGLLHTDAKKSGNSGSAMLMQLRKAANHHLLHRRQYDCSRLRQMAQLLVKEPSHCDANVDYVYEDMEVMSDFELHQLCRQHPCLSMFTLDVEQITDSGKFRWLDENLPKLKEEGSRVLLFSQFVIMLDIMEPFLKSRKFKYLRLDGSTPVAERQELIDRYSADKTIFIFLLSTRAGGLGINLTAADTVIIHDIDFNPYNDKQAEDRCHRVGQTKEVKVYRMVSKGTIEEGMYRATLGKLRLEADVTGSTKENDLNSNDVASLLMDALDVEEGAESK